MQKMKGKLSGLLAIIMILCTLGMIQLPAFAATVTPGDVNGDGAVNVLDAAISLRLYSGASYAGTVKKANLFVSGDNLADMSDAVLLLRKAAGWDVELTAAPADASIKENTDSHVFYYGAYVKFMSQNIRHSNDADPNSRAARIQRFQKIIPLYSPDIIGVQEYRHSTWFAAWEGTNASTTILDPTVYSKYVVSRADPARDTTTEAMKLAYDRGGVGVPEEAYQPDERLAIFWKTSRFSLLDQGYYWLSATPDVNSAPHNTELTDSDISTGTYNDTTVSYYVDNRNRLCIWVKLKDNITGSIFYYFDTHLNASTSIESRTLSSELVVERLKSISGDYPAVISGDFNLNPTSEAYVPLGENLTDVAVLMGDEGGTFSAYNDYKNGQTGSALNRIDYFFTNGKPSVVNYKVVKNVATATYTDSTTGQTVTVEGVPSDHYGIYSEMVFE